MADGRRCPAASRLSPYDSTLALNNDLINREGTAVTGLLVGLVDTPMSAGWELPKVSPASAVGQAYDGVAAGRFEILADDEKCSSETAIRSRHPGNGNSLAESRCSCHRSEDT